MECEQWIYSLQLTITNLFKSPNNEITKFFTDDRSKTLLTAKIELKQKM